MKKQFNIENFFWFGIFRKVEKKKRIAFLVCCYLVFLLILIVQWQKFVQNGSSIYGYRTALVQQRINNIQEINDFLETEAIILSENLKQLNYNKEKLELSKLAELIGNHPFTKSGAVVVLKDSKAPMENEQEYIEGVVHNNDLLKIINLLWSLGAKAISINGNRVLFGTEIICSGPTILINDKIVNSPFYIKAGGDLEKLMEIKNDDYINFLKSRHVEFFIKKMDNINISSRDEYTYEGG
ncbi:MAG: DUF881 domain-containing protein [Candidatus Gastranaerophilaceae bacterium]